MTMFIFYLLHVTKPLAQHLHFQACPELPWNCGALASLSSLGTGESFSFLLLQTLSGPGDSSLRK